MARKFDNRKVCSGLDLDFVPGRPLMIQFAAYPDRYKSVLIGTDRLQYVIIQIPVFAGVRSRLTEGNRITVRYVDTAAVYGFHSVIRDFIFKPHPLLFLDYPASVEVVSLRGEDRMSCYLDARLETGGRVLEGAIVDLSYGGCRFSLDKECQPDVSGLSEGCHVALSFALGLDEQPVTLLGQLRGLSEDKTRINLGLMFDKTQADILAVLSRYVDNVRKFIEK